MRAVKTNLTTPYPYGKVEEGNRGTGTASSATVPTQALDIKTALRLARNL